MARYNRHHRRPITARPRAAGVVVKSRGVGSGYGLTDVTEGLSQLGRGRLGSWSRAEAGFVGRSDEPDRRPITTRPRAADVVIKSRSVGSGSNLHNPALG